MSNFMRKYLQKAGLVSMLLFVGVLGGLMAPLPSDAFPVTVKIRVILKDGTSPAGDQTITVGTGTVACPPGGYNYCFPLVTGGTYGPTGRQFKVLNGPNGAAQVSVIDFPSPIIGVRPADGMTLSNVQFVPTCSPTCSTTAWPSNETVKVKITISNLFNNQPNPPNNGTTSFYSYGLSIGGYYSAQSGQTAIGNITQSTGSAILVTTNGVPASGQPKQVYNTNTNHSADLAVNPGACTDGSATKSTMCKTVAAPGGAPQVQWNLSQSSNVYPGMPTALPTSQRFACTNNASTPKCVADVTQTHIFTLLGPDIIVWSTSSHSGGGGCGPNPLPSCDCDAKKGSLCEAMEAFIERENQKEKDQQAGIPEAIECSTAICNGTLIITGDVTPAPSVDLTFKFLADGPRVEDFDFTVKAGQKSVEVPISFTHLITGRGGTDITITPDYANWPSGSATKPFYQVDQAGLESVLQVTNINQTDPNADVDILSCPGGHKTPVITHAILQDPSGNGDTVIVNMHIHNSQTAGVVCPIP